MFDSVERVAESLKERGFLTNRRLQGFKEVKGERAKVETEGESLHFPINYHT